MTAATFVSPFSPESVRQLEPALFRYARSRVRSDALAHDLVQETWAAALSAVHRFEGRSSIKTWMTAILRRKIVDHHRRSRPSVSFEEYHAEPVRPPERERMDDLAAVKRVEEHLPELPRREREAVTLIDIQGFDREEAANEMGINRGALRVLLHRGRHKLKDALVADGALAA